MTQVSGTNRSPEKETSTSLHTSERSIRAILGEISHHSSDASQEALLSFLTNAPDPILLFDGSANILAENEHAVEFWDGRKNFVPSMLLSQVLRATTPHQSPAENRRSEIISIESMEGKRYFLPTIFPLFEFPENDSTESPFRSIIACILKDETEWMRSEMVRNNLFSSISHELNTPLTSARLALYLLAEKKIGDLNPMQTEMVERAKQDLDREIATIRNVLDLIRSRSTGANEANFEPLNLHDAAEAVIAQYQSQSDTFASKLIREYSNERPWVRMEENVAKMTIHLLIASVLKHCEDDAKITISTHVSEEEGYCQMAVCTPGEVLPNFLPDDLFSIPMEDPEARMLNCADLGLRVAHEMIAPHGGSFETSCDENHATVSFRYPLAQRED